MSARALSIVDRDRRKRIAMAIANPATSPDTHGPSAFGRASSLTLGSHPATVGQPLISCKTVTGLANVDEGYDEATVSEIGAMARGEHLMPSRVENRLMSLGANYVQAGPWGGCTVLDSNLITGQQHLSGAETAARVIEPLFG